jgi:molybdopterin-binding protein
MQREKKDDIMKESIRNRLPGTIKSIVSDKVMSEVIIETAAGEVAAVITSHSAQKLGCERAIKCSLSLKPPMSLSRSKRNNS